MKTDNLSLFLDHVSALIKSEKLIFTDNFFKDKHPETMTFLERKEMYAEYYEKWKIKEDELYTSMI